MLYVFTGSVAVAVRARAHAFLDTLRGGEAHSERVSAEECTDEFLRDRIGAQSLFGGSEAPQVFLLDTPSEKKDALERVVEHAPALAESANIFVLIEGKLLAAQAKPLKAAAAEYHEVKADVAKEPFNAFALADALARRDKKSLWVLLVRAQKEGLSAEEIIGTLYWQLKSMRLVTLTKSPAEAGLKPFVYSKAQRGAVHFKDGELEKLSEKLVTLYHEARLGKVDIDLALERWVLDV